MSSSAPEANGSSHLISDFEQYLSTDGKARKSGSLSNLIFKFAGVPDVVGFHGGLPRAEAFPFSGITFDLVDGGNVSLSNQQVSAAQQYNLNDSGYPPLQQWAAEAVEKLHAPPGPHSVAITTGSNHALDIVLGLLLERGDYVITEEHTYPHMIDSVTGPRGYKLWGVRYDDEGIIPAELEKSLKQAASEGRPLPKLLYTVPIGQNPASFCIPLQRRQEIYAICQRHDLLIVEDDPYWALQFPAASREELGLSNLGRSFLSLDTDGRVARLDSFAKMLAPGLRVGWLTAHPDLTARFCFALHGSCLGANTVMQDAACLDTPLSLDAAAHDKQVTDIVAFVRCSGLAWHPRNMQVVLHQMLLQWGWDGLDRHCKRIQSLYRDLADVFHETAQQELTGLAEWKRPEGGMFIWMKFLGGVQDYNDLLDFLLEEKVAPAPGSICVAEGLKPGVDCPWARICFAAADHNQVKTGVQRLAKAIRKFQSSKQSKQ